MSEPIHRKPRAIPLLRCSTAEQAETSPADQLKIIQQHAARRGDELLEPIRLDGVSASNPQNMDSVIADLIARKKSQQDFDLVVVQDPSRLTRAGAHHAGHLQYQLERAGIPLVYANNDLGDPRANALMTAILAQSASDQVKTSSFNIARGLSSAVAEGRKAYCGRPPFGIDRRFLDARGEPVYIIRNLPDGSQIKLSPDGQTELGRYGKNPKKGARVHHVRQKTEKPILILGDPAHVATVGRIYMMSLLEKRSLAQIVSALNQEQRTSPNARPWQKSTVEMILRNPIYSGIAVAFRLSQSKFYRAGQGAPVEAQVGPDQRTLSGNPTTIRRPASDWVRSIELELQEFLPVAVRAAALEFHERLLKDESEGHRPTPRRDPAPDSEFILKGILTSKQGNHPMTGTIAGRDGQYRHYRIPPRAIQSEPGSIFRRRFRADEIESVVLGHVRQILMADPNWEKQVESALRAEYARLTEGQKNRAELVRTQTEIVDQILQLSANSRSLGPQTLDLAMKRLQPQLDRIERELAQTTNVPARTAEQIKAEANAIAREFNSKLNNLESLPRPVLRELIASVIASLTIDLESCELAIEMRLPDWAMRRTAMGQQSSSVYPSGQRTHQLRLPEQAFPWPDGPCCRRRKAA